MQMMIPELRVNRREFFKKQIPLYRQDVCLFAKEVLNFTPDKWQQKIFEDITQHNRITVRSGHGVGKTGCEAVLLLWFLSCFSYPRVVATAPTRQQLHDVLWAEVAKWQSKSPLLAAILKWTKTRIYMKGYEKRWFAVARTATKPENMQGFHEDNMLFIVDEASGVADPIMEAVLGALTGDNNKLAMFGNPTKTSGVFFDSHNGKRGNFKAHRVSSEDSPRTNKENIKSLADSYGKDSNVYRVRVLGEFPLQEDDVYIPLHLIDGSIQLGRDSDFIENSVPFSTPESIHIACDVARFGGDKTVIGFKTNAKIELPYIVRGQDTMKTADKIIELGEMLIKRYQYRDRIPVKIDDGGVGGGVVDRLRQVKRNNPERFAWMEVFPVKFGTRIKNKYYHDSTSYMTGIVKKLLEPIDEQGQVKPVELLLPDDDNLAAQLSCRKYRLTEAGKIQVESKDAMKKRGLPSPDEADCVLLLCLPVRFYK